MFTIKQADDKFPNGKNGNNDNNDDSSETRPSQGSDNDSPGNNTVDVSGLFNLEKGYPEIIIKQSNITETSEGNTHTLTIIIDENAYNDYVGDMIKFELPNTINVGEVKITREEGGTYTCPIISYSSGQEQYNLTNMPQQTSLFLRIVSLFDNPLSLFTNGDMRIVSMVPQSTISTPNVIKCDKIDAVNTFNLYRSPLPNLYDMKEIGELVSYWYAYFGYEPGSDEFNELIDGQEFRFTDDAFGSSFKLTKTGDKWDGANCCYNIHEQLSKNEASSRYAQMYMKWDAVNQTIINKLLPSSDDYIFPSDNPLKWLWDNNKLAFDFYESPKFYKDGMDGEYAWIEFTDTDAAYDYNKTISITIDLDIKTTCSWEFHSIQLTNVFHPILNQIDRLRYVKSEEIDTDYHFGRHGLYLLMPKGMIYPITDDLDYVDGTNPFAFLADKCCYTITPRPEACTTLETTYNIRTSGVVIGQNIESHAFALNSIGNTVDRAVNRVEDIQRACETMEKQISEMKNKTDWLTVAKDVFSIAASCVSIVNGIRTFATFAKGAVGGVAAAGLALGKEVSAVAEEEVVDEIIRDVDVLAPGITAEDLELIRGPTETTIKGVDTVVSVYHLPYIQAEHKLALITLDANVDGTADEIIERIDYDVETKTFAESNDPNVKIEYHPDDQVLIIIGKVFDKVQNQYIRKLHGLGANSIGTELTNKKLLTAAAVKKLIDNNLKPNVLTHFATSDSLTGYVPMADYKALLARVEALEGKELNKQIEVLENKCANIYSSNVITDESTIDERISVLEGKCSFIDVEHEEIENPSQQQRLEVIKLKCANIE